MILRSFNAAVFDNDGKQVPELQTNLIALWAQHAAQHGYDPTSVTIETHSANWKVVPNFDGSWNLQTV